MKVYCKPTGGSASSDSLRLSCSALGQRNLAPRGHRWQTSRGANRWDAYRRRPANDGRRDRFDARDTGCLGFERPLIPRVVAISSCSGLIRELESAWIYRHGGEAEHNEDGAR